MMQTTAFAAAFLLLSASPLLADEITCANWPATTTLDQIKAKYGAKNVVTADLPGAEGETYKGTVVFAKDKAKRFEVTWWDEDKLATFGGVTVAKDSTGPFGLKLGMSIKDVQKINGKAFNLSGFDWDYGGAPDFTGGKLEKLDGGCYISMTFATTKQTDEKTYNQVAGDKTIRSDMKAIDKVKPVITALSITWPDPSGDQTTNDTGEGN